MKSATMLRLVLSVEACFVAQCLMAVPVPAVAADSSEQMTARPGSLDARVFLPDNLVVSRTVYDNNAGNVIVGTVLPPNCAATTGGCSAPTGAIYDGTYPDVWNNDIYDASFGITAKIVLDQMTPRGRVLNSIEVPHSPGRDHLVTSFSSKSELALNLSTDRRHLTFMGYVAPIDALDVSNSNTPAAVDATNPVGENFYRAIAEVGADGKFAFTNTNAYSGNNGRAAIEDDSRGVDVIFTVGNAGNGANPQPDGVILGAGAQITTPAFAPQAAQSPGVPTPVASFSVTELGAKADKIGKDDNFRGMTVFNDVLYFTKGSGSNGVNTVYFVDTVGGACPKGTGLPAPGAKLPTRPLSYDYAALQTAGLPNNVCILAGFPSTPNKSAATTAFPFGIWFADDHTLYVADEGDGYTGGADLYSHAAAQSTAGLQKWILNKKSGVWSMAYVLTQGLDLGTPYTVEHYPGGTNAATGLPWSPATDGLRNIIGRVGRNGVATIWGITSTVSGNGDVGADPNRLVVIRDVVGRASTTAPGSERFVTLRTAGFAEALRGVAFTPGSDMHADW